MEDTTGDPHEGELGLIEAPREPVQSPISSRSVHRGMESGELAPSDTEVDQRVQSSILQTDPGNQDAPARMTTEDDTCEGNVISEEDQSEEPEQSTKQRKREDRKEKVKRMEKDVKLKKEKKLLLKQDKEKKEEHDKKVAIKDAKKAVKAARKKSIAVAQQHAQSYEGMGTRSRAQHSIPEAQEESSPSGTSSDDEPPTSSGKPRVPGETMESHSLTDEDDQGELSESDTSTLLSDSNDEDGESNVNETDAEDETQKQPPSVPNHPAPDEGIINRPTARPRSGTTGKRADREHMPQGRPFSHSSCLKRNTARKQLRHLVKQGMQQQRQKEERKHEAARIAESGGGAAKRKMQREAKKLGMSYKSYKLQWAQQKKLFREPDSVRSGGSGGS